MTEGLNPASGNDFPFFNTKQMICYEIVTWILTMHQMALPHDISW